MRPLLISTGEILFPSWEMTATPAWASKIVQHQNSKEIVTSKGKLTVLPESGVMTVTQLSSARSSSSVSSPTIVSGFVVGEGSWVLLGRELPHHARSILLSIMKVSKVYFMTEERINTFFMYILENNATFFSLNCNSRQHQYTSRYGTSQYARRSITRLATCFTYPWAGDFVKESIFESPEITRLADKCLNSENLQTYGAGRSNRKSWMARTASEKTFYQIYVRDRAYSGAYQTILVSRKMHLLSKRCYHAKIIYQHPARRNESIIE